MTKLWSMRHLGIVALVVTASIGVTVATPIAFSEKNHHDALGSVASPSSAASSTESVLRRSSRRRRSGYDVTDQERDVDAFPFSSVMSERDRQRNLMNLERNEHELFDVDAGNIAEKRGRWAKNNVQIWGKRSHPSDAAAAADPGVVYPQQHASHRLSPISLPRSSVTANDDGLWSKRKKTWEKNNFKMWGKRADSGFWNDQDTTYFGNDDEASDGQVRDHVIGADASRHRLPSWAGRLDTGRGKEASLERDIDEALKRELFRTLIPGANVDRLHHVELERPLTVDDDDSEPNVALPFPVASSDRQRLPWYKRGAWATNNMRIWG